MPRNWPPMTPLAGLHQTNGTWDTEWCFIALRDICVRDSFLLSMLPLVFHWLHLHLHTCTLVCNYNGFRFPPKAAHPWLCGVQALIMKHRLSFLLIIHGTYNYSTQKPMTPLRIPINGAENAGTRSSVSLCYINGPGGRLTESPSGNGRSSVTLWQSQCYVVKHLNGSAMLHCVTVMGVPPQLMSHHLLPHPHAMSFTSEPLTLLSLNRWQV